MSPSRLCRPGPGEWPQYVQLTREQAGLGRSEPAALALGAAPAGIIVKSAPGCPPGLDWMLCTQWTLGGTGRVDFEKPSHSQWGHLAAEVTTSRTWQ